ncbi:hypothetical protein D3C87_1272160 [compost metagenome]
MKNRRIQLRFLTAKDPLENFLNDVIQLYGSYYIQADQLDQLRCIESVFVQVSILLNLCFSWFRFGEGNIYKFFISANWV